MFSGNKGEWSEVYALLKLLSEKKLIPGDDNLNELTGIIYPIIKILRDEAGENIEYIPHDTYVEVIKGANTYNIGSKLFLENADLLLKEIKNTHNKGAFKIPCIEAFLNSIQCTKLKAKSSDKTDIRIVIHDIKQNFQKELGFSIKSQLGNPSTLFNAGANTNFIYRIEQSYLTEEQIHSINNISSSTAKIKKRLDTIKHHSGVLNFAGITGKNLSRNLILIDSKLDYLLAEMLLLYYTTTKTKIKDLTEELESKNPLNFPPDSNHKFYEYKTKKFLTEIALGMMPSKVWNGIYDATGGYLVVRKDGKIVSYHIYDRNQFENYLFNYTKLETPSSSRHKFGTIYKENGELFINLNLQIRFLV